MQYIIIHIYYNIMYKSHSKYLVINLFDNYDEKRFPDFR